MAAKPRQPTPTEAEQAVSTYLTWLEDPDALIDHKAVAAAEAAVNKATDPIAKVIAFSELERASTVDGASVEEGFIRHAKRWARKTGVTASALQHVGVPKSVLTAAGLYPASTGQRHSTLDLDEVLKALPVDGGFTMGDAANAIGRTRETARKYIAELEQQGWVERIGVAETESRGRSPILYHVVS